MRSFQYGPDEQNEEELNMRDEAAGAIDVVCAAIQMAVDVAHVQGQRHSSKSSRPAAAAGTARIRPKSL